MACCPRCHSTNVAVKKKVETLASGSAALYGLKTGSEFGLVAGPVGTIIGGAIGALLGGIAGSAIGSAVDEHMSSTAVCHDCGHEFSI